MGGVRVLRVPDPELQFSFEATLVDGAAFARSDDARIRVDFIGRRSQCGRDKGTHAGIRGTDGFLHRNKIAPAGPKPAARESLGF